MKKRTRGLGLVAGLTIVALTVGFRSQETPFAAVTRDVGVVSAVPADPVSMKIVDDLGGWVCEGDAVEFNNPGDMLDMMFINQLGPTMPASAIVKAGEAASGGRFHGNYEAKGVKCASFRFRAADMRPSAVWLVFRSASGNEWHVNLNRPSAGEWTDYKVALEYSAGWTFGPSKSEQQFLADIRDVEWIGVYVRRSGSSSAEHYNVDDFRLGTHSTGSTGSPQASSPLRQEASEGTAGQADSNES